jgi:hypothetical protein
VIGVYGVVAKCDGVYFRCAVDGCHADRWLEVPAWMFERASCPGDLQLTAAPFVSLGALGELSALLDQALKTSKASSNAPLSGASRSSHDQIRGEADASDDGDEQRQAQAAAWASADGPVRQRQAGGAPLWPELPERARSALTEQMAQLILAHAAKTVSLPAKEAGDDL